MTNTLSRKRFGQHFLRDEHIVDKIIHVIAPQSSDLIVEIGPGEGILTEHLIESGAEIHAIEIDRDLITRLQEKWGHFKNFTLHAGDALHFDFSSLSTKKNQLRVVGNLPYNISSPLLFKLFDDIHLIKDMHFMLQKELVMRLTALVDSASYSRLSVMSQYFCHNTFLFSVPSDAFVPRPKVVSAFLQMIPRMEHPLSVSEYEQFKILVKEAFNYRRKTLANAVKKIVPPKKLMEWGIDIKLRPQQLSVEEYIRISQELSRLMSNPS